MPGPGFVSYSVSAQWSGDRVSRAVGQGAARGCTMGAEYLRSKSVPLAPLDRGPLRESATVNPATEFVAEATLVFDVPYAAAQHEREDYQHDDGQAHYVSEPMTRDARTIQGIIAREVSIGILHA